MEKLQEGIQYLLDDSQTKKPQVRIDSAVEAIETYAKQHGLPPELIEQLVGFVVKGKGGASTLSHIIRTLLPQSHVPFRAVLCVLASLRSLALSVQQLLLRWTVLTFDLVDDIAPLRAVYDAVFYHLQVDELRSVVCQLLCYLTARSHVTEWRVQRLLELQKQVAAFKGSEPPLTGLLTVYRLHRPDLVGVIPYSRRKVWFQTFEKPLASNIARVQTLNRGQGQPGGHSKERLETQLGMLPPPTKRSRKDTPLIPLPFSSSSRPPPHASSSAPQDLLSVTQVTSYSDLLANIDRLSPPCQMAAILTSPLMMQYFAVCPDRSAPTRLKYWLMYTLDNGYEMTLHGSVSEHIEKLLKCLVELRDIIMEPIPVVEQFLELVLENWDGDMYQKEIFQLLSHISLQPFDNLLHYVLLPLKNAFLKHRDVFKYDCLATLVAMLEKFAVVEWPHYHRLLEATREEKRDLCLFQPDFEPEDFSAMETVTQFISFTDELIELAVQRGDCNELLLNAACSFHSVVSQLPSLYGVPVVRLPTRVLVYRCLFASSAVALVRMCQCLVSLKCSIVSQDKTQRDREMVLLFNGIILDMVDALWRNSPFTNTSRQYPTAAFNFSREFLESCGVSLPCQCLNLSQHRALVGFTLKFFHETQPAHKTLHPSSITSEARSREIFLDYLQSCHLNGLVDFIRGFVISS